MPASDDFLVDFPKPMLASTVENQVLDKISARENFPISVDLETPVCVAFLSVDSDMPASDDFCLISLSLLTRFFPTPCGVLCLPRAPAYRFVRTTCY